MPEQNDSSSTLPDNLLALPLWAAVAALGLLSAGVAVGFVLLFSPGLGDALRSAGGQLLVVSLPVLALAIGVLGASWARTERIDHMEASYLRHTVGDKLEAYLIAPKMRNDSVNPYPPLFRRMERHFRDEITSYCYFRLFDEHDRPFDMMVKSNVFNFEISFTLQFTAPPIGYASSMTERSYGLDSLADWSTTSENVLVQLAAVTLHGSLAEGYTIYIKAEDEVGGGLRVTYRLRQKLQSNFLTSPYLRRYFSEDAAIASSFFYAEAFSNCASNIQGGVA